MFLNIWAIDDDQSFLDVLEDKIQTTGNSLGIEVQLKTFVEYKRTEDQPDLWLLDIDMPVSGFDLSRSLNAPFIFMSSHENYVYESFDFLPYAFVRKDHIENDLSRALKRYINDREKRITIQCDGTEINVFVNHILRMYKEKNYLVIATENREYKIKTSLNDFLDQHSQIMEKNMIRISRSELINLNHIIKLERDCVILKDGTVCYPSRMNRKETYARILEFMENAK